MRALAFFAKKMTACTTDRRDNERSHRDADALILDVLAVLEDSLTDPTDRENLQQIMRAYREATEGAWWYA